MVGDRGLRTVERDGSFARADSVEFGFWISVEGGKPTKPKGGIESALVCCAQVGLALSQKKKGTCMRKMDEFEKMTKNYVPHLHQLCHLGTTFEFFDT
jgi:hypothetical protein